MEEMDAKEETTIERQARMREQAKALKEKREQERMVVVQEKLERQWRCIEHHIIIIEYSSPQSIIANE